MFWDNELLDLDFVVIGFLFITKGAVAFDTSTAGYREILLFIMKGAVADAVITTNGAGSVTGDASTVAKAQILLFATKGADAVAVITTKGVIASDASSTVGNTRILKGVTDL